jgi:hypothetical protein
VKYRTQTELLGQTTDKAPVVKWLTDILPNEWEEAKKHPFLLHQRVSQVLH